MFCRLGLAFSPAIGTRSFVGQFLSNLGFNALPEYPIRPAPAGVDRMRARMQAFRSVVLLVWPFMPEILRTYCKCEEYGVFSDAVSTDPAKMKAMLAAAFGPGYQQAGDATAFFTVPALCPNPICSIRGICPLKPCREFVSATIGK